MRVRGDGAIIYGNQASLRLLRHWEIAVGQQVPEEIQKLIAPALGSGTAFQGEVQVQDRHFALTLAPVAEQALVNVYGLDITELKKVKEKFQILVDASPLGVSLVGPNGRYRYLNPKFTAIFGYTLEDIPEGRDWFRKAYPDETYRREVIAQWLKDLHEFRGGESRPRAFKVICKDGTEKVIYFSPVSMETGDQLVIYEDITERKKLEIQLIQAQKMEAAGTLAGGIAHDFNNLLMAIQGNVSLMLMDLPSHHPDRERLQHIEACVRSGADLTKQLLGFARRGKYQVKPTDLNDLIDKASALFGRTQKGIRIQKKLAEGVWTVEVDRGTTFNFYIPASAKEVEEERKEPATLRTGQGGILLVDDEEIILQVAAQLLEKLGYTVFVAHNGREALDLYSQKAGEIDLVILDLIMPVMGGGETFQSLKKMNPRVKVLLASGYSINGLAKEILDQGCRGFIQKPFDLMEISVKIREILDQEGSMKG